MKRTIPIAWVALVAIGFASAATPPSRINYQGVLRDNTPGNEDAPLDGDFEMVFRFFDDDDPALPENEILVDTHSALGTGAVTVSGGLFNVMLGAGQVSDGTGAGTYSGLGEVFRDFTPVWLEIEVAGETLLPRVQVASAAYALNATHFDGAPRSEFIDTSAGAQVKAGDLTVGELTASGDVIWFGQPGARILATPQEFRLIAGDDDLDKMTFCPGSCTVPASTLELRDGDFTYSAAGNHRFYNVGPTQITETVRVDSIGNLRLFSGEFVTDFGRVRGDTGLRLQAGLVGDTHDLRMNAGDSEDDGAIIVLGTEDIELRAGNGNFQFRHASTGATNATLDPAGNLDIIGTYTGDGSGLTGVDAETFGGNLPADYVDLSAAAQVKTGDLSVADLTLTGDDLLFGAGPGIGGLAAGDGWELSVPVTSINTSRIRHDDAGSLGGAAGFVFDGGAAGLIIESLLAGEGSGIFMNGDFISMWSPGDSDRLLRVYDEDGMIERFWIDGDGDAFVRGVMLTSSRSKKQNILPLPDALDRLRQLQGVSFEWKSGSATDGKGGKSLAPVERSIGFIAEDVARVFPELVTWNPDGRNAQALNYSALIAVAIEAIKELGDRVALDVGTLAERTPDPITGIQSLAGNLEVVLDRDADSTSRFSVMRDGGTDTRSSEVFRVDEHGNVFAMGSFRPNAMDLAEYFPVGETVEAGDVLGLDPNQPGKLRLALGPGDAGVVGIVSTRPGVMLGAGIQQALAAEPELAVLLEEARARGDVTEEARLWNEMQSRFAAGHAAVALSGSVPCKVDAGYGAIRPGDLLTTSPTPGHAMRADEPRPGTILGKALEPLDAGTGHIRVLVMLR